MPYRSKTYIAFDADSDIHYYRLMHAWKQSDNTDFDFVNAHDLNEIRPWSSEESIKRALHARVLNSKVLVLLIGEKTKYQNTYVRWEIEQAIKQGLPIIGVNLDGKRSIDETRCPLILRDKLAVHTSFNASIIQHALEYWPSEAARLKILAQQVPRYYSEPVYQKLGL